MSRLRWIAIVLGLMLSVRAQTGEPVRVLFVGNSLTYYNDLPATLDAVARANRMDLSSDMLAASGATLSDRVRDGSVQQALAAGRYAYVVMQERGGDFACGFGPQVCVDARAALATIADAARSTGAVPILLGTYQPGAASKNIEAKEAAAAVASNIRYLPVSERLWTARERDPSGHWLAEDGMHPGPDLTLLEAMLLFDAIGGRHPAAVDVEVRAPRFGRGKPPAATFTRAAPGDGQPMRHDAARIAGLGGLLW